MAEVTINSKHETLGPNIGAYNVEIAHSGDTLSTPFSRILAVSIEHEETVDGTTYTNYSVSGGVVTITGGGTGFTGTASIIVVGYMG